MSGGDRSQPGPGPGATACPTCGEPMARVDVRGLPLATCPAHGTWIDNDEMHELVGTVVHETRYGRPVDVVDAPLEPEVPAEAPAEALAELPEDVLAVRDPGPLVEPPEGDEVAPVTPPATRPTAPRPRKKRTRAQASKVLFDQADGSSPMATDVADGVVDGIILGLLGGLFD